MEQSRSPIAYLVPTPQGREPAAADARSGSSDSDSAFQRSPLVLPTKHKRSVFGDSSDHTNDLRQRLARQPLPRGGAQHHPWRSARLRRSSGDTRQARERELGSTDRDAMGVGTFHPAHHAADRLDRDESAPGTAGTEDAETGRGADGVVDAAGVPGERIRSA